MLCGPALCVPCTPALIDVSLPFVELDVYFFHLEDLTEIRIWQVLWQKAGLG